VADLIYEVDTDRRTRYSPRRGEKPMARKELLSIYVPQSKQDLQLVERLIPLGEKRDRSVNYLVVEAIL